MGENRGEILFDSTVPNSAQFDQYNPLSGAEGTGIGPLFHYRSSFNPHRYNHFYAEGNRVDSFSQNSLELEFYAWLYLRAFSEGRRLLCRIWQEAPITYGLPPAEIEDDLLGASVNGDSLKEKAPQASIKPFKHQSDRIPLTVINMMREFEKNLAGKSSRRLGDFLRANKNNENLIYRNWRNSYEELNILQQVENPKSSFYCKF